MDLASSVELLVRAPATRLTFLPGSALVREDGQQESVFVVLSGRVELQRTHRELTEPVVLREFGPGEVVGRAARSDASRSTSIVAIEVTEVLAFDRAEVRAVLEAVTGIGKLIAAREGRPRPL